MRHLVIIGCTVFLQIQLTAQTTGNGQGNCGFGLRPEVIEPTCPNSEDGSIIINTLTPVTDLLFHWEGNGSPLPIPLFSNTANNLKPGNYRVVVRGLLCSDTLHFKIGPPPILATVLDTAICDIKGVVNLLQRVEGGNGNFSITSARSVYGNALDCDNCESAEVPVDRTSLFNVVVRDDKGCEANREVFVQVFDSLKTRAEMVVDETCTENGSITMRTIGGSGDARNYRYLLNGNNATQDQLQEKFSNLKGNEAYRIQVTDVEAKGCRAVDTVRVEYDPKNTPVTLAVDNVRCYGEKNGRIRVQPSTISSITGYSLTSPTAAMQQNPVFENLPPNEYKVFVLEGPDCYVPYSVNITEPEPLNLASTVTDPNCPGQPGSAELQATGGNGGYRYALNNGTFQFRNVFENLRPGNYKIVVRDSLGCENKDVFTVGEPESPPIAANVTASCPGDSSGAIVIVEGGKLLYGDYLFSLDSMTWQQQNLFEGLAPGQYTVFVWYPDGCIYKVIAIVPQINAPGVFFSIQNTSCPGSADGSIVIEITNGETDDYLYSLDMDTFILRNAFKDLIAGNYHIYLQDSLECIYGYPFEIKAPEAPTINLVTQDISCFDGKDGKITIQTSGGKAPFTYALNSANFSPNNTFDGLGAIEYAALVRDANGCIFGENILLSEPLPIEINFTIVDETCGNQNGVAVGFPSGGTLPYRFIWNTGDTTAVVTGLPGGNYQLTITDQKNCKYAADTKVQNVPGPVVLGDITDVPCNGSETGAIQLTVIGGSEPLSYKWSNGLHSSNIYNLTAGSYTVTVTDSHQCLNVKTFNLYEPAPLELSAQTGQSGELWFINLVVQGGIPSYNYEWSSGETSEDIFNLKAGTYNVTVTDREGCSQTLTVEVGTTSTTEPDWAAYVNVFPNPTKHNVKIVIDAPTQVESKVGLFDITGRLIFPMQIFKEQPIELDVERLPAGVYLLQIEREKAFLYRRIVKQ
ncbi:MAG: T9SS type A sorting domain-containing protein [Saprospiraceae bacterium]|nr:T9SS type A sorting domain-containing protein [Saprospiraceae bacterium]